MGFFYNNSEVIEDEDEKKRIEDLAKAEEDKSFKFWHKNEKGTIKIIPIKFTPNYFIKLGL